MKFSKTIKLILFCALVLSLTGCSRPTYHEDDIVEVPLETESADKGEHEEEEIGEVEEVKDPKELINLDLKPNEVGEVMVLMYHNVGEEEEEWVRTPENLRKDLEILYEKGYRAVSLKDYVNNDMEVEAGMTPVVITFDDGNENNFRVIEDNGNIYIDPDSVIGILEEFKKDYPDFNTTASFFVFGSNPFRQNEYIEYKLKYLVENGYDIGNHTLDHRSMKKATDGDYIQEGIGKQVAIINEIVADYEVNTYALAYGERPKDKELEKYLEEGSFEGASYKNIAILNVGWNPASSPVAEKFNPLSIPRIRASETKVENVGLYNWLEYFDNNPKKRYISDGFKEIITVPMEMEDTVDTDKIRDRELYIYE